VTAKLSKGVNNKEKFAEVIQPELEQGKESLFAAKG